MYLVNHYYLGLPVLPCQRNNFCFFKIMAIVDVLEAYREGLTVCYYWLRLEMERL